MQESVCIENFPEALPLSQRLCFRRLGQAEACARSNIGWFKALPAHIGVGAKPWIDADIDMAQVRIVGKRTQHDQRIFKAVAADPKIYKMFAIAEYWHGLW